MKTLYITDLDGTFLNRQSRLSDRTERLLNTLLEDGAQFTVATMRSIASIKPIFSNVALRLPVIELNGAFITDMPSNEKLAVHALDDAIKSKVYEAVTACNVSPILLTYHKKTDYLCFGQIGNEGMQWYWSNRTKSHDRRLRQFQDIHELTYHQWVGMTAIDKRKNLEPCKAMLEEAFQEHVSVNILESPNHTPGFDWLNVTSQSASKYHALQRFKATFGFDEQRIVSFGDQPIDIAMFEASDVAIAVENAHEDVKRQADIVIGDHESDSVIEFIYHDYFGTHA